MEGFFIRRIDPYPTPKPGENASYFPITAYRNLYLDKKFEFSTCTSLLKLDSVSAQVE